MIVENYTCGAVSIQLVSDDYMKRYDLLEIEKNAIVGELVGLQRDIAYTELNRLVDEYAEEGIKLKNRKVRV